MAKEILVSVCVPVYGVEKYIRRCAISLFEQTYYNIEYIFINDCTKDRSIEVLMDTLEDYPNRKSQVSIINHQHNKGLAGARNTGVQQATGEFILWVDSDDYMDVTTVEKMVNLQMKNNSDIVCCDSLVLFPRYNTYFKNIDYANGKDLSLKMIQDIAPHQLWGHLIKSSLYVNNNITAVEGINQGEDWHVMPRLAYYANKVDTLHEALYFYDMTSVDSYSNNMTSRSIQQINMAFNVLKDFFSNKEPCFSNALRKNRLMGLAKLIMRASILDDENLLKSMQDECEDYSRTEKKQLKLHYRLIISLKNKHILKLFSLCIIMAYNLITMIKNNK